MVRAKVIASAAGTLVASLLLLVVEVDKDVGAELADWIETALIVASSFGAGYAKRETRDE